MVSGAPKGQERPLFPIRPLSLSLKRKRRTFFLGGETTFFCSCLGFLGFRERFFFESEGTLWKCQISGRKKSTTHTPSSKTLHKQRERERREKGRESEEEEDRRLRRLPLPPFLSPSFFWEEEDVLDDERERTLIEIVTPHDYTIICAQRESTKRARERAKEREKRGEEDGLLLFLSRASFVGSRKRRTPWQTRRI